MKVEIKEVPFSWHDNFSEVALEDFNLIVGDLVYCTAQSIGQALAKLQMIENGEFSKWIPCNERLPKDGEIVLVSLAGDYECNIEVVRFESEGEVIEGTRYYFWSLDDYCINSEVITAWMPLPEPYKEEQK